MMQLIGQAVAVVRWIQIPLVALFLLGGCAAKAVRVVRAGSVSAGLGPSELFPRRLRRPAAATVCVVEFCLGTGLALTARRTGIVSDAARLATAVFFLVAMFALVELRERRPDVGCGCFGDLSTRPVGRRSIIRAGLLAAAALTTIGARPLPLPASGTGAAAGLGAGVAELALLAVLSPETAEVLVRLGYSAPCELRVVPPQRVIAALHRSTAWRRRARLISAAEPVDMWRELCWWYVVYPASDADGEREVVFAVQVKPRRPAVRAAVVAAQPPRPAPPSGPPTLPDFPAAPAPLPSLPLPPR